MTSFTTLHERGIKNLVGRRHANSFGSEWLSNGNVLRSGENVLISSTPGHTWLCPEQERELVEMPL